MLEFIVSNGYIYSLSAILAVPSDFLYLNIICSCAHDVFTKAGPHLCSHWLPLSFLALSLITFPTFQLKYYFPLTNFQEDFNITLDMLS